MQRMKANSLIIEEIPSFMVPKANNLLATEIEKFIRFKLHICKKYSDKDSAKLVIYEIFFLRTISASKKRQLEETSATGVAKRIRTPSPVSDLFDKQVEELNLFKSRMKYASISAEDFAPVEIFEKFPQLRAQYRAVINTALFGEKMINSASTATVEAAVKRFKDMLIHSIVRSQQNNWIFITQVEAYYHEKEIDDVAQVDQKNRYAQNLIVGMEKCQEGKGSWHELRFWCQKVEIVATGGYYSKEHGGNKLGAFFGVAAPFYMALDTNFILFSPVIPVETLSCIGMLRNLC